MKKLSLLIMFFVLAGAGFFWSAGGVTAGSNEDNFIQRAVFKVENLSCGACFSNINAGLLPLEGFTGMGANLFRKLVAVDFIAPLSPDKIQETISRAGYGAALASVDAILEKESFAYLNDRRKGLGSGPGCSSTAGPGTSRDGRGQTTAGGSCCTLPGSPQVSPEPISIN